MYEVIEIVPLSVETYEWLLKGQNIKSTKDEFDELITYQCNCGECINPQGVGININ